MAMKKIRPDEIRSINSVLIQESEIVFRTVSTDPEQQVDLAYRQLFAFAMRYYRNIPKKRTRKGLLARSTPTVDTSSLREMADLASRLGFKSLSYMTTSMKKAKESLTFTGFGQCS